ncbi:MAG: phosphomannomutase/phosphoglucomutase [Acidimicrobiia bacterium]|nr:MAG: phosphomannomutase/phosphoglucomutase [Acidimicrobiia bacterium]
MDLSNIIKAYDVRGVVPDELDEDIATRIGAAFAAFVDADEVIVGHDCRVSSPAIREALIDGITSRGVNVRLIGEIPTDMLYYASGSLSLPGVVITASHNPSQYNGLKFCQPGAAPIGADTGLQDIRRMAEHGLSPTDRIGLVVSEDVVAGYLDHVIAATGASGITGLTVAADGGNGMAGAVLPQVFDRIDADLIGLYLEPDGMFPNHPADPLRPENLVDLVNLVNERKPDLGVAFDGDADRAFFIDDSSVPLPGSTTTAIIADWFLAEHPASAVVHNLICSKAVPETIEAAGGLPIRTKVGHSYIKQVMAESGAIFGGEHSGHYYFRDNYRADSGIMAMLVLLRVLTEARVPLSELRKRYEPYAQSGEINFDVADKAAADAAVERAFEDYSIDRLDGLTVDLEDRWFNLRPSNTEPVLRLNVEGPNEEAVDDLVEQVAAIIKEES